MEIREDIFGPVFGTYALPAKRERIRKRAEHFDDSRWGRWGISLARKRAIRGLQEPFDVVIADGVKARLYPSTNRCEKRALAGVQIWDAAERAALKEAIQAEATAPFVFLDIGANVGLYSLFANAYARQVGRDIRLLAIEPSKDMIKRLYTNSTASDADVRASEGAIATDNRKAFLSDGGRNRGEGQLSDHGQPVSTTTLTEYCWHNHVDRIDALKLDIEGQDLAVLTQFFQQAPESLHPDMMILELDETSATPLIELTQANDYLIIKRTRMNVVVRKRDQT